MECSGNVGIGNTSPGNLLSLASSAPRVEITDTDTNGRFLIDCESSAGSVNMRVDQDNVAASSAFLVSIDGTERARIDSSGRLGIGVSSPQYQLHLGGSAVGAANGQIAFGRTINTCLLYTSPSPRDRTRSRMPSSA